jgi:hypothetical protein
LTFLSFFLLNKTNKINKTDFKAPTCFISYSWTPSEQKAIEYGVVLTEKDYGLQDWLRKLQGDLALAGIS